MRAIRASVVYLSTCLRVNVPKECQVLIFTCQRANQHASVPKASRFFNLACQSPKACQFFKLACQCVKGVPFFSTSPAKKECQLFIYLSKKLFFHIPNISVPNIFYILYILNIYLIYIFYMNIFFYLNLYTACKKPILKSIHQVHHKSWWKKIHHVS